MLTFPEMCQFIAWFGVARFPMQQIQNPMTKDDFERLVRGHLNINQWKTLASHTLNMSMADINAAYGTREEVVRAMIQACPFR